MLITFAVFAVVFVLFLVGLLFYLTPVSLTKKRSKLRYKSMTARVFEI